MRLVWTFRVIPGVAEGDRGCSAVVAAGCRGRVREGARLPGPPVCRPLPGSWREMTPRQTEDRRWSWRFR
jgi:hypothetical protein